MNSLFALLGLVVTVAFIALPFMVYSIMGHVKRIRIIEEQRLKVMIRNGDITWSDIEVLQKKGVLWKAEVERIRSGGENTNIDLK